MGKKLASLAIASACALTCAIGLVGCGGNDNDPYYNKTYTLTGTCTIDWTGKNYIYTSPEGVEERDVSQRQILEKVWDKIDWDKTFERNEVEDASAFPHSNKEEFIGKFADYEQNYYKSDAGLKISISGKDDLKLTLTIPDTWDATVLGKEITMQFAETPEQYAAIKPHASYAHSIFDNGQHDDSEIGYRGLGVYKIDDSNFLTVDFYNGKYAKMIDIQISYHTVLTDDDHTWINSEPVFRTEDDAFWYYNSEGNTLDYVRSRVNFEVE